MLPGGTDGQTNEQGKIGLLSFWTVLPKVSRIINWLNAAISMSIQSISRVLKDIGWYRVESAKYRSESPAAWLLRLLIPFHKKANMECWRLLFVTKAPEFRILWWCQCSRLWWRLFLLVWLTLKAQIFNDGNSKRAKSEAPVLRWPKSKAGRVPNTKEVTKVQVSC